MSIAVFDLGGTWFRWGLYDPTLGLLESERAPAINYLSHPERATADLQDSLVEFIVERVKKRQVAGRREPQVAAISLGAPVNAHDLTVLGSGPLWGPDARPFRLHEHLAAALPDVEWTLVNDVTALLARYFDDAGAGRKTVLITVSSGIGSRLYDHRTRRVPFDSRHGIQGEIGHLVTPFEIDGRLIQRRCECGGWNHLNAFSSGRGIAQTLRELASLSENFSAISRCPVEAWAQADDEFRAQAFRTELDAGNAAAHDLLDKLVTPLSRSIAAALALDPEVDRFVLTGGVVRGLGTHYRHALLRTFAQEGLYQITQYDPDYLSHRLLWDDSDDFAGLKGAALCALAKQGTAPEEKR